MSFLSAAGEYKRPSIFGERQCLTRYSSWFLYIYNFNVVVAESGGLWCWVVYAENDLLEYIESTVTEKLPKSKGKKPSETAGTGQPKTARNSGSKKAD